MVRKIAMPVFATRVSSRLDSSESVLFATIRNASIVRRQEINWADKSPYERTRLLLDEEVDVLICGGLTETCATMLRAAGINVISWMRGDAEEILLQCMQERSSSAQDIISPEDAEEINLSGRRILFILPPHSFKDEEYFTPRLYLEKRGASITVASSSLAPAEGMLGTVVFPEVTVDTLDLGDFHAMVLIGGLGCTKFWHDPAVHRLANEATEAGKVVGAICLAPVTLANAGLLRGKLATAYSSAEGSLERKGALFTGRAVETAGNIVTANGPDAAEEFGYTIATLLNREGWWGQRNSHHERSDTSDKPDSHHSIE